MKYYRAIGHCNLCSKKTRVAATDEEDAKFFVTHHHAEADTGGCSFSGEISIKEISQEEAEVILSNQGSCIDNPRLKVVNGR